MGGTVADCPSCGRALAVDTGFVTWCDGCEWNLEPQRAEEEVSRRERRRRERALRRAERIFADVSQSGLRQRATDAVRIATFAISIAVLLLSPLLLGGAVVVVLASGGEGWGYVVAAFLALIALAVRPRFGRVRRRVLRFTRSDLPAVFGLVDRIAAEMHARPPQWMVVDGAINASTRYVGLRRRGLLHIGTGLWAMLDDRQRVAVLAHEIAHGVNGDSAHGLVVGTALDTLGELQILFIPSRVLRRRTDVSVFEHLADFVSLAVAHAIGLVRRGLVLLLMRGKQCAEYRADLLAAGVAGTEATASALDSLTLAGSVVFAVERAQRRGEDQDPSATIRTHVANLPPREHERLRRIAARRGSAVDDTHPPTPLRVAMVRRLPDQPGSITLSPEESSRIEAELREAHRRSVAHQARRR